MDLAWLEQPFRTRELSPQAQRGVSAARALRDFHQGFHGDGVRQLAAHHRVHGATLRRWIRKAAHEVTRPQRTCAACPQPLPRHARATRRYCDTHASSAERVRRYRARLG